MTSKKPPRKPVKDVLILTGIAFQMGATIFLFVLFGKWLDQNYNAGNKTYLIIATLLGVAISLYAVLQQIKRFHQ